MKREATIVGVVPRQLRPPAVTVSRAELYESRRLVVGIAREARSFRLAFERVSGSQAHIEALEYVIMRLVLFDLFGGFLSEPTVTDESSEQ